MIHKLKNGHWPVFLLSSFSSIGNLFLPLVLVRLMTPDDVGIYKIFFLHVAAIPFIFLIGGPMHSVFYWVGKEEKDQLAYLNATFVITLSLSVLAFLVGYPLKEFVASHLDIPHQYVALLLLTGSLFSVNGHFTETSIALGKNIGSVFDTVSEILKAIGFIYIAWAYKNLSYILYFFAAFMGVKIFLIMYLNKTINNVGFKTDKEHIKKVFMYSLPMSISGLLGFFVDKVDMLLLSSYLDASSFAYYSLGCLVIPPLYLLEMSVQKVLIPSLSKAYATQKWSDGSLAYRKAIKDISFLIIPSIFGLVTFAAAIVEILYTDQYLESIPFLQIFAFSYLLLMLPHDSVVRATGKTAWILKLYFIVTPISLIAAFFAANHFSARIVLIVTLIIKFIPKFYGLKISKELMHWNWNEMFPFKHLQLFTSISVVLSIISFLTRGLFVSDVHWFLISGSLFALIYLVLANKLGSKGKYLDV